MKNFLKNLWNSERLFRSYITSLCGVVVLGYLLYLLSEEKVTTDEIVAFGGWAFTLFLSKDPKRKNPDQNDQG